MVLRHHQCRSPLEPWMHLKYKNVPCSLIHLVSNSIDSWNNCRPKLSMTTKPRVNRREKLSWDTSQFYTSHWSLNSSFCCPIHMDGKCETLVKFDCDATLTGAPSMCWGPSLKCKNEGPTSPLPRFLHEKTACVWKDCPTVHLCRCWHSSSELHLPPGLPGSPGIVWRQKSKFKENKKYIRTPAHYKTIHP